MAKLCKSCGVKHANDAKKCICCGAEFHDEHIYARRRIIILLAVCGALLLTAAVAFSVYSATPEAAVRRIMNACKKADVDTVISYYPDFYLESDKVDKEKLLLQAELRIQKFSEELYTFYLEDPATPSERECKELIEALEYYGGDSFDKSKLGDIKMIWVNYRLDVYYFWPKRGTRFIVFEYDGEWCWWPANVNR